MSHEDSHAPIPASCGKNFAIPSKEQIIYTGILKLNFMQNFYLRITASKYAHAAIFCRARNTLIHT
jgi:hypothetical protein